MSDEYDAELDAYLERSRYYNINTELRRNGATIVDNDSASAEYDSSEYEYYHMEYTVDISNLLLIPMGLLIGTFVVGVVSAFVY